MEQNQQYLSGDGSRQETVDDLTHRLNRINVNNVEMETLAQQNINNNLSNSFSLATLSQQATNNMNYNANCDYQRSMVHDDDSMMVITSTTDRNHHQERVEDEPKARDGSNILIVTNVEPSLFSNQVLQTKFESLFMAFDPNVTFRYLKSFRRVRLDFTCVSLAEAARSQLGHYKLDDIHFRCYPAQIIKPNHKNGTTDELMNHLNIPKLTKQFLISPPASPPVGWEPIQESTPSIDVQLISAIANLVPGKVHEIHPPSESHPGIFVEVCEEPQFENSSIMKSCSRIPRTASPNFCQ